MFSCAAACLIVNRCGSSSVVISLITLFVLSLCCGGVFCDQKVIIHGIHRRITPGAKSSRFPDDSEVSRNTPCSFRGELRSSGQTQKECESAPSNADRFHSVLWIPICRVTRHGLEPTKRQQQKSDIVQIARVSGVYGAMIHARQSLGSHARQVPRSRISRISPSLDRRFGSHGCNPIDSETQCP
jgi:hypothetical protein